MIITKSLLNELLLSCSPKAPESGGIIGGSSGEILVWAADKGYSVSNSDCYFPNVEYLNSIIEHWQSININFLGIYHNHFSESEQLSGQDKEYFQEVIDNSGGKLSFLFCPLIYSNNRKFTVHRAQKTENSVIWNIESVELI